MTAANKLTVGLLAGAATVAGLALAAPTAHADNAADNAKDAGRARMMIKEAKHAMSEARCHVNACPDVFPAAEAKVDKAVTLSPTPEMALEHCHLYSDVNNEDKKWAMENGKLLKALARCDFAANHPDSDEDTRKRAIDGGGSIRSTFEWSTPEPKRTEEKVAAAKALYGTGLKMKYDKKSGKISLAYGDLDAATLQRYIAVYWAGHAYKSQQVAISDTLMLFAGQGDVFFKNSRVGIWGWVMREPLAKFKICESLMYGVNHDVSAADWCKYQALVEANAPSFAFRGKDVSWDVKTAGGGLALDERIFLPTIEGVYTPAVSIAGPVEIDDYQHITLTKAVAYQIKTGKHYQDMLAIKARAEKIDAAKRKAYAKQDMKVGGKKGKIVFSDQTFIGWNMPPLLKNGAKGVDCDDLSYKAYAPRKKGKNYELYVKVDGKICHNPPLWSDADSYSRAYSFLHAPFGGENNDGCKNALLVPGDHKIEMTAHEVKASKTGRKQVNRNLTISDEYMGYSGKKLFGESMTCTTKGSGTATSRFE